MKIRICLAVTLLLGTSSSWAKPGGGYRKEEVQFSSQSSSFKNGELIHEDKDEGFLNKHEDLSRRTSPIVDSQVDQSKYRNPGHFETARLEGQDAEQYINQFVHGSNGFRTLGAGGVGGLDDVAGVGTVDQHLGGVDESTNLRSTSSHQQSSLHGSANLRPGYTTQTTAPGGKAWSSHSSWSWQKKWSEQPSQTTTTVVQRPTSTIEDERYTQAQTQQQRQRTQQTYAQRPSAGYGATTVVHTAGDSAEEDDQYEEQTVDQSRHQNRQSSHIVPVPVGTVYTGANTHTGGSSLQTKRIESQSQVHQEYVQPVRTQTVYTSVPVLRTEYAPGLRPLNGGNSYRTLTPVVPVSGSDGQQVTEQRHESSSRIEHRTVTKPQVTITAIPVASSHTQRLDSGEVRQEYGSQRPLNTGNTYRTLHVPSGSHVSGASAEQITQQQRQESSRSEHRTISQGTVPTSGTVRLVTPVLVPSSNQDHLTTHQGTYYVQRPSSYPAYSSHERVTAVNTVPAYTKTERKESRYVQTTSGGSRPSTVVHYPATTTVLGQDSSNFKHLGSSSYGTSGQLYTHAIPVTDSTNVGGGSYRTYHSSSSNYGTVPTGSLRAYSTFSEPVSSGGSTYSSSQKTYKSTTSSHAGHGHTTSGIGGLDDCDMQGDDPGLLIEHNFDVDEQYEKFGKFGYGKSLSGEENKRFQRGYGYGRPSQYNYARPPPYQGQGAYQFHQTEQQHATADLQPQQSQYGGYGSFGGHGGAPMTQQTQDHDEHEDLTQQSQKIHFGGQEHEDLGQVQQKPDKIGKLELLGQKQDDFGVQQSEDGFGKLEFGGQEREDVDLGQVQQKPDKVEKLELLGQKEDGFGVQQSQDGFGKLEFGGQEQEDLSQRPQKPDKVGKLELLGQKQDDFGDQADLTQQTQDGFGKLEFGGQGYEDLGQVQQKPDKVDKLELGRPAYGGFGGNRQQGQQKPDKVGKLEILGQKQDDFGGQEHEDMTQQTQDGFGKLEFGAQEQENLGQVQQKPDKVDKLELGRQTYAGYGGRRQEGLTWDSRTQNGFGKLEVGGHQQGYSSQQQQQQKPDKIGQLQLGGQTQDDFGGQETEDLTQQTQDAFGKFEFGGQEQENWSQQPQKPDKVGKLQLDGQQQVSLTQQTQQSQYGLGKIEASGPQRGYLSQQQQKPDKIGQLQLGGQTHDDFGGQEQEDLTQQTQDTFGKFEFGGQEQENLSQQQQKQDKVAVFVTGGQTRYNLTQQQYGQGKLEYGNQYSSQTTTARTPLRTITPKTTRDKVVQQVQIEKEMQKLNKIEQQIRHEIQTITISGQNNKQDKLVSSSQQQQQTQRGQQTYRDKQILTSQQTQQHDVEDQEYEDLGQVQQKPEKVVKLEFSGQEHDDLTQQTQDGFGKFEFGAQKHDKFSQHQQKQDKIEKLVQIDDQEHEDLTQQQQKHDDGFAQLQVGNQKPPKPQHDDFTQQSQDNFGQFEFGGQQQEDLTQQQEDLTQQQEDLTQQQTDEESTTVLDSYALRQQQYERQRQQELSGGQSNSPYVIGSGHYASYPTAYGSGGRVSPIVQSVTPQQGYAQQVQPISPPQVSSYGTGSISVQKVDQSKEDNSSEEKESEEKKKKESAESEESKEELVSTTTTEKPGFWKRVGGKLKEGIDSAKEGAKKLADKVSTSVG